ncbi:MAG: hypothetical protein NC302_04475 [Bacteroidales bacterium]|nr:hypothetical protein [Bacteroidales bacterium]MCM1422938.1 hypothetical protein [bacterium]
MLFSCVDLTALATEAGASITTEEEDTQNPSQEAAEESGTSGEEISGGGSETPVDGDQATEDGDGKEEDAPAGEGFGETDAGADNDDKSEGDADMTGDISAEDEDAKDGADTEKDEEENPSVSENAVSVSENAVSVSENTISISENSISVKAANSLGTLLLADLQIAAQEAGEKAAASYAIGDIEVSGTTANVLLHAAGSCTAVVAVYEEDSEKPCAFGSAVVPEGENQVTVEIAADSLPTYFKVKGYLVETDTLRPLSGEYCTVMYTKAMQEFLAKTADDFGDAPVLNLDEDKTTNFLVLKEGNLLVKEASGESAGEETVNRLVSFDEANASYTFENVDESVKGLKSGDIFVYQYGKNDFHIIKVKTIELQGTAAIIVAEKEELSADEVFQHVRIDQVSGTAGVNEISQEDCPEGVTYLGRKGTTAGYAVEEDPTITIAKDTWKYEKTKEGSLGPADGSLSCDITAGFGAAVKLHYYLDWTLFYVDVNFEVEASVEGTVSAEGEVAVPLVAAPLETTDEESLFVFSYTPKFVVGGKIEATVNLGMSGSFGVKLGIGELEEGTYGPYNNLSLDIFQIDAEATIYLGIKFDPQLKVGDIFNAELECGALIGGEAAAKNNMSVTTGEDLERHECGIQCVAINGYLDIPLDGELKMLKWKEYDLGELLDVGLEGSLLKIEFANCYYSFKHTEFGWGDCPHKEYLITCTVKDKYGKHTVAGASIGTSQPSTYALDSQSVEDARLTESVTESKGNAVIWLPAGKHTLYVSKGGKTTSNIVQVDGAKKQHLLYDYVEEEICFSPQGNEIMLRREDGSLWKWGTNKIEKIMENVREVSLGSQTNAVVTDDGALWMWGSHPAGGTSLGKTPVRIMEDVRYVKLYDCGICIVIKEDGSLWTAGKNDCGLLGNGTTESSRDFVQILDCVKTAECYGNFCAAITEDGGLWTWGSNEDGQIGNGTAQIQLTPFKVMDHVTQVTSYGKRARNTEHKHIAAITEDGSLYLWGSGSNGQIGNGKTAHDGQYAVTTPYRAMANVKKAMVSDAWISAAITNSGDLYMWGGDTLGLQYGVGQLKENYNTPTLVMKGVLDIFASDRGAESTITALRADGSLYTWGGNYYGQIGNDTTEDQYTAVKILDGIVDFRMNDQGVSSALSMSGELYLWGRNWGGIIGNGVYSIANDTNQLTPYRTLDNVRDYELSSYYAGAVTENGDLWLWGSMAGSSSMATPTKITFPDDTQSVSAYSQQADTQAALMAVHTAQPGSPASFTGLIPNETYNFYAMKTRETETPLASDNLLYIGQYTSDGSGNLSIPYEMREAYETPEVFVVGLTRLDLSAAQITIPDILYTGSGQVVEAVVTYDGKTLTEGVDYEIYGACLVTEPGEYQVVVKGIGDYCGAVEVTFRVKKDEGGSDPTPDDPTPDDPDDEPDPDRNDVLPEDVPADGVIPEGLWIAGLSADGYPYTGSVIKPQIRVYDHKILLKEKTDYTIAYKNNKKVNDASVAKTAPTITVTGKGNYSGKDTAVFQILPLDISGEAFDADDMTLAANGKAQKPIPTLWWENKKLKNKTEYTVTYYHESGSKADACKEVGNYEVELAGVGNFTGTRRIALRMTDQLKLMSRMTVVKIQNQTLLSYNGSPVTPTVTVKEGKTELTEGTHYTVSYRNNTKIGSGYAIVKGLEAGGYSGTKRVSFKITGVSINRATVSGLTGQTFVYDGTDKKPALQLALKTGSEVKTLAEGDDYSVTWQKNRNAGTATVIFSGNQQKGYIGTVKKTFKIKAFHIAQNAEGCFAAELTEQAVPYAKGGSKPTVRVTFRKADGTVETLQEKTDYTLSYQNNKAVNDGSNPKKLPTVTIKGKGNFTGTFAQKLNYTIVTQDIGKLSITAADKTYQNKKNIYTTKVVVTDLDGKVLKAGTDYEKKAVYTYKEVTRLDNGTTRQAGEVVDTKDIIPAGTALEVCVSGKGNYTGTLKGGYRITQASISAASVTIPAQIYTGRRITPGKDVMTVKIKGKPIDSSQYEIVSYQNNVKKGKADVTIRGVDNYGGTKTVKFQIRAKGFLWWKK